MLASLRFFRRWLRDINKILSTAPLEALHGLIKAPCLSVLWFLFLFHFGHYDRGFAAPLLRTMAILVSQILVYGFTEAVHRTSYIYFSLWYLFFREFRGPWSTTSSLFVLLMSWLGHLFPLFVQAFVVVERIAVQQNWMVDVLFISTYMSGVLSERRLRWHCPQQIHWYIYGWILCGVSQSLIGGGSERLIREVIAVSADTAMMIRWWMDGSSCVLLSMASVCLLCVIIPPYFFSNRRKRLKISHLLKSLVDQHHPVPALMGE